MGQQHAQCASRSWPSPVDDERNGPNADRDFEALWRIRAKRPARAHETACLRPHRLESWPPQAWFGTS